MTAISAGSLYERATSFTAQSMKQYDDSGLYRDMSTVLLVATRGMIPINVVLSWLTLGLPINQRCAGVFPEQGKEVGAAYESLFAKVADEKASREQYGDYASQLLSVKFAVTMEEDNIPPPDGLVKLLAAMYVCPEPGCNYEVIPEGRCQLGHRAYSAISGLYHMKTEPPTPMAFGDPSDPSDFKPRRVIDAIRDEKVIEVNGIAMGFAVWRTDLFRKVSRPWFQTRDECTQDIFFCKKAKDEVGARFGVHCGVKVGHLNVHTGEIV